LYFVYYLLPAYIKINYDIIPKSFLDHLRQINFLSITSSYFGLNSIIYFTHIDINLFRQISVLIGFFQNILILSHIFFPRKEIFNKIQNLILKNPLLCIGIIGSLLLAFARTNNFEQVRYSQFSIFFQIGFFIFIYQNYQNNFLFYKKKFFLFLFLFLYSISIIGPFSGIRFAIHQHVIFKKIYNECNEKKKTLKINTNTNATNSDIISHACLNAAYSFSTYKYDYLSFLNVIYYLNNNNLSFFNAK
jgi:hypothetical protein